MVRTPVRRAFLGVASTATLALLLGYAPTARASAGDDAHVVAVAVPGVGSGARVEKRVGCPAGERAIGGGIGFVSSGGVGAVAITTTQPTGTIGDAAPAWISGVSNTSGAPKSFTYHAICSASSDAVVRAVDFTTAGDGGSMAPCQPGERAIGGGVAPQVPTTEALVQVSGPVDETGQAVSTDDGDVPRSWFVSVRHYAGTGLTFRAFALCSATSTATVQATAFTVAKGESGQETALCPTGQRALSGGLGTTGGRLGLMGFSGPTDANGTPIGAAGGIAGGWTADVYNVNPGLSETYKVFVVCEGPSAAAPGPDPGPAPGPTTPTTPGTGGQTDTAVEADVIGASAGKSRIGKRVVRLELSLQENVSATLTLLRKGTTLATKQFASVKEGERVLTLRVPAGTANGRATLRFELRDVAGNTMTGQRSVRIRGG